MAIRFDEKTLLHAYVIEGEIAASRDALFAHLAAAWGFQGHADPDLFLYTASPFGIDDARNVRERGQMRPIGERKYFVIATENVTLEAQNALLKTLEEPAPDTHFFLLVRTSETLLPTLRSRVRIVRHDAGVPAPADPKRGESDMRNFLAMDLGERLSAIGKIDAAKKDHPDDAKREARALLDTIERTYASRPYDPHARRVLSEVIDAKRRLAGRSPSLKMLLEYVALLVPRPASRMQKK
ncbi:MAG TPA: hypothetical protein VLB83_04300 [Candidatus Paceibacterota bacterium]|nr:hypothetical protein [Candidatus Paceibacterota bacterium]